MVDSNGGAGNYPVLDYLDNLGAKKLSFLALTHPHKDHYMGLGSLCKKFGKDISEFYSFPVHRIPGRLKQLAERYRQLAKDNDSVSMAESTEQFLRFLSQANQLSAAWHNPTGFSVQLAPPGFGGVSVKAILPPGLVKGRTLDALLDGRIDVDSPNLNDLSIALMLEYGGQQIVLGGDGTAANWTTNAGQWSTSRLPFSPVAVKLPHHGSEHDCSPGVLNFLFPDAASKQKRYAIISANGRSHPSADVLSSLVDRGVHPYCTNLATVCAGKLKASLPMKLEGENLPDPELLRFVEAHARETTAGDPCQGNVILAITATGTVSVTAQHKNACPLRGDLQFPGVIWH